MVGTAILREGYSPITSSGKVTGSASTYSGGGKSVLFTDVASLGIKNTVLGVSLQSPGIANGVFSGSEEIVNAFFPHDGIVHINGPGADIFEPTSDWHILSANAGAAALIQP